ncbi:hypothetical protein GCM10009641_30200 [Mycobacterium cookii]|uniref:Metallophosphoesterase n=1 Tax=Nocardioides furvisabuli TaxID=375542 RepID=A0ABP5J8R3_9ACTN|nr:hypothetical protein [Nocardioides furvisabuli]
MSRQAWTRAVRTAAGFVACGLVAATLAAPVAAERALEGVRFSDRLGSVPVEVSLAHNGVSTFDTGILGSLYWERTGVGGFGAVIRATGPPQAGGTLSSYVSPEFVEANSLFLSDPDETARTYGDELRALLWRRFLLLEIAAGLAGGLLLMMILSARPPVAPGLRRGARIATGLLALGLGLASSAATAAWLFDRWSGSVEPEQTYPMPGIDELSFSSPEALEIARQVRPFISKNTDRIRERVAAFEATAEAGLLATVPVRADALSPREGEVVVVAEADPQGSLVGTRVRTTLYALLQQHLSEGALVMRTISGDVTSNGTVAEAGFVAAETGASGDLPLVVVKGDHDTETTMEQLADNGVINPDADVASVGGLDVVGADDPAFKALFGGLVINDSGISETALGADLRSALDAEDRAEALVVLLHQPRSAAGYIGVESLDELDDALGRETVPWDDGVPDLPPGIINIGHLHDAEAPRVIWNTDGEAVTWTVLNQLGTAGGVEENPTFNRFSTPFSTPLKDLTVQLQYVDGASGLQTGYAQVVVSPAGDVTISDRVDLGLPLTSSPPAP